MGMIVELFRASPQIMAQWAHLWPADEMGLIDALQGYRDRLDLETAWQGVHFALTGAVVPVPEAGGLNFIYNGQPWNGSEEVFGIAPPLYLSRAQMSETAAALGALDISAVTAKLRVTDMAAHNVYRFADGNALTDAIVQQQLAPMLAQCVSFFLSAAREGQEGLVTLA